MLVEVVSKASVNHDWPPSGEYTTENASGFPSASEAFHATWTRPFVTVIVVPLTGLVIRTVGACWLYRLESRTLLPGPTRSTRTVPATDGTRYANETRWRVNDVSTEVH